MAERSRGLYESLVTQALAEELEALEADLVEREGLRAADAADRIGLHLGRAVKRVLSALGESGRVETGVALAERVVELLAGFTERGEEVAGDALLAPGEVLTAVKARLPDGSARSPKPPLIPLLDTVLLTNAPGEPRVGHQVHTEIDSADRIDVVMAFIRLSGIRPLLDALRAHGRAGRPLRVLTTVYTGTTEAKALAELIAAGAEVRVSYDVSSTRLHAKSWLFYRESGFSTAYIGSSNLTHSAQVSGLEWNLRISGERNPDVIEKMSAVFESYWERGEFVPFDAEEFEQRTERSARGSEILLSPVEIRPEPFQERLLEQIAVARSEGHHRNLLVSATGTGKTVMAALDYARLRSELPRDRLLFVAHRKEILNQSLATFRHALRDPSFGELWVDGAKPERYEHVFASIQSLSAATMEHLMPEHFDVVQVDEFHHAAAKSYTTLLDHVKPKELLGLTATPERADDLSVLTWFDGRIAAELRLWDAIDQHRLAPFAYYGVHDGLDLSEIPWRRGQGYDTDELTNLITATEVWAKGVIQQLSGHVEDPKRMRALGFCVSVKHARYMARVFEKAGISAVAVWADSSREERQRALNELRKGTVNVVFSVDLFNEGVDVPMVDTLLMLRPSDSATLFLQQLGRGLRHSPGKALCTVLDFVGQHRREFRFDRRLRAILGGTRKDAIEQVEQGFPFLPAGCHMELDRVATKLVLQNIKGSLPAKRAAKAKELTELAVKLGRTPRLAEYLDETGLGFEDLYSSNFGWSDLLEAANLPTLPSGAHEKVLRRGCGRLGHLDDRTRLEAYRGLASLPKAPALGSKSEEERRLLRMLVGSLVDQAVSKEATLEEGVKLLWQHPQVLSEVEQIAEVLRPNVDHLHHALPAMPSCPLRVHARYTRVEILAALGIGDGAKVAPWQTGVYFAKEANADLFAFTLDKTSGQFSPTTRYRDYAITSELIHWESQSATRADSETGERYQNHTERRSHILMFARLRQDERAFWFLGPASYVKHEGERPMAITWRLGYALPGDLFASFAAAVA